MINAALGILGVVAFVLYLMRRRTRLAREE
jgi:hypothetical protein